MWGTILTTASAGLAAAAAMQVAGRAHRRWRLRRMVRSIQKLLIAMRTGQQRCRGSHEDDGDPLSTLLALRHLPALFELMAFIMQQSTGLDMVLLRGATHGRAIDNPVIQCCVQRLEQLTGMDCSCVWDIVHYENSSIDHEHL